MVDPIFIRQFISSLHCVALWITVYIYLCLLVISLVLRGRIIPCEFVPCFMEIYPHDSISCNRTLTLYNMLDGIVRWFDQYVLVPDDVDTESWCTESCCNWCSGHSFMTFPLLFDKQYCSCVSFRILFHIPFTCDTMHWYFIYSMPWYSFYFWYITYYGP